MLTLCWLRALLLALFAAACAAEFNHTKCPAPWELQSDRVKKSFSLKKFQGDYFELALHDYTQYPVCPKPRCMSSHKVVDYQMNQINDTFYLVCIGKNYTSEFHFRLTDTPGFFLGKWTLLPSVTFPDTVVDVYENEAGEYEWVIEFQCVEKVDHVWFVGLNWYSRQRIVSKDYIDSLLSAARKRGLSYFMDYGTGVTIVDQNCTGSHAAH